MRNPARKNRFRPLVESLEDRSAPVVGAFAIPAPVLPGTGFDGVVQLFHPGGSCTGSLLFTGRHILTAAHCVDTNGDRIAEAGTHQVVFQMPTGNIVIDVPAANITVHPNYNANSFANDIAVMRLTDPVMPASNRHLVAPIGAERYDIFRARNEVGQIMRLVGYGQTGTGTQFPANVSTAKRTAFNRVDTVNTQSAYPNFSPNGTVLAYDFDNGDPDFDAFAGLFGIADLGLGTFEGVVAAGDSGGPSFIGDLIAGIPSLVLPSGQPASGFFGGSSYLHTRVSSFASSFIDLNVGGDYHLILDMNLQPGGNDGDFDIIKLKRTGGFLQITINGVPDPGLYPFANILSLTVRGSADRDSLSLDFGAGDLIPDGGMSFDGGAGRDEISVSVDQTCLLSDQLRINHFGTIDLSSVAHAGLAGGTSGNSFVISSEWTGSAIVIGSTGNDQLRVHGSKGADNILVDANQVDLNAAHISYFFIDDVAVLGNEGADTIRVNATLASAPVTVNAGTGNDSISLGSTNQNLDLIDSLVTVHGEGDVDSLLLHDQANGSIHPFTITAAAVSRPSFGGLQHSGLENLTLNAGAGSSLFEVRETTAAQRWTINGGEGNDAFSLGHASFYGFVQGNVTVNGQGGTNNTVIVDDRNGGSPFSFSITGNTVGRNLAGALTYNNVQGVTVHGGSGGNTINVATTASGTPVIVNAGNGNDTITVGFVFFGFTLNGIQAQLTVNGQGGALDKLNLRDDHTSAGQTYGVRDNVVSRSGIAFIGYGTIENLVLNSTGLADKVFAQTTAALTPVTINTAAGNDEISIGNPSPFFLTVNSIRSLVTLNGGKDIDTLFVDDSGDPTNNIGAVSTTAVTGLGMTKGISHSLMDRIEIYTGAGNDFVTNMVPRTSNIAVRLDLGGGEDGVVFQGTTGNDVIRIRREVGTNGARAIAEINGRLFVNDYLNGETVVVHAGNGNDRVVMEDTAALRWGARFYGELGNDQLFGNAQRDRLDGGKGNDLIKGLDGDDVLIGGPGLDTFVGGAGADQVFAADGNLDTIFVDDADVLTSHDGFDRIIRRRR